jgi:hypothetical protein
MLFFYILIGYGFLAYVAMAFVIFSANGWAIEWDEDDLTIYIFAPVTVITLTGYMLRALIFEIKWLPKASKQWPYTVGGLVIWSVLMSIGYLIIWLLGD